MAKVVLVRSGDRYGPDYVTALTRQIEEHNDCAVVTLTDQDDTPGDTLPLRHGFLGWWSKLELLAPHLVPLRPFLFVDLDSFVFGDLAPLMQGDQFRMVQDFYDCAPANSSVMWVPERTPDIWDAFLNDPERHMREAGSRGDQWFFAKFAQALWRTPNDGITSFKVHGKTGPAGIVMQFHGKPKPADMTEGWVHERWRRYAAA